MSVSERDLKLRYAQMSDEGLLDLWSRNTLTESAQMVLLAELHSRGMTPPPREIAPADDDSDKEEIEPWVTIARRTTAPEAHIVRARLESEGIPALVADEHLVTANWFLSNAIGGVRIQVPQSYIEHANEILKELEAGEYTLSDDDETSLRCPHCDSDKVVPHIRSSKISLLALFFFLLPLPFNSKTYKCQACGHVWKVREEAQE
jgi:hypothetical protein